MTLATRPDDADRIPGHVVRLVAAPEPAYRDPVLRRSWCPLGQARARSDLHQHDSLQQGPEGGQHPGEGQGGRAGDGQEEGCFDRLSGLWDDAEGYLRFVGRGARYG
jgi:hypothetical protein